MIGEFYRFQYLLVIFFLIAWLTGVQANDQGSKLFKRPGDTLPKLKDYLPEPESEMPAPVERPQVLNPVPGKNRFKLKKIILEGNQAITDAELTLAIDDWLGQIISEADLEAIRMTLTQVYKKNGYISSGAMLKDWHMNAGIVTFTLIEGRLEAINITHAGRLRHSYIKDRLRLNHDGPLQPSKLEKNFKLLLSDPLIDRLNGVLKLGTTPGATILDLEVTRHKPFGLYLSFDNYTPPSIGSYTGRLAGYVHNLTGFGDIQGLAFDLSQGLKSIGYNFAIPMNAHNTTFSFDFQASHAKIIEFPLHRANIESDFYHLDFALSQPVYKSLARELSMEIHFAYRKNTTSLLGQPFPFSEGVNQNGDSVVSVVRGVQNFNGRGAEHTVSLRSIFSIGINAFGSGVSTQFEDSQFFSWIGQAHYAHRLDDNGSQIMLRGNVQLSDSRLLSLERFALGGHVSVRGYRENYRVKDEGYAISAELHYQLLHPADFSGHRLFVIPFTDIGRAWNHNDDKPETIYSTGIGLKWGWQRFSASLFWAHPLTSVSRQTDYDLQDESIYFQLSTHVF